MTKVADIYNYLSIAEGLSTSGQPSEQQLRALAGEGCELIINLALHDDPRYSLPDEQGLVETLGMQYVHIPVQFVAPTGDDLLVFFFTMEANAGKRIHVHCAANMRVTAFLGLYRLLRLGLPQDEAFAPMRSVWAPDEVWSSFIADAINKYTS